MITRIILTVLAILCVWFVPALLQFTAPTVLPQTDTAQLQPSDTAYYQATVVRSIWSSQEGIGGIAAIFIALVWLTAIPGAVKRSRVAVAALLAMLLLVPRAHAYYDNADNPEFINDVVSHYASWEEAVSRQYAEADSGTDDECYWEHELTAFRRDMGALQVFVR